MSLTSADCSAAGAPHTALPSVARSVQSRRWWCTEHMEGIEGTPGLMGGNWQYNMQRQGAAELSADAIYIYNDWKNKSWKIKGRCLITRVTSTSFLSDGDPNYLISKRNEAILFFFQVTLTATSATGNSDYSSWILVIVLIWQGGMKWNDVMSTFLSYNCYIIYTMIGSYLVITLLLVPLSQGWNSNHIIQFMNTISQAVNKLDYWYCLHHPQLLHAIFFCC